MQRVGRARTIGAYHLDLNNMVDFTSSGMPIIMPCDVIPDDLTGFNYATGIKDLDYKRSHGVHFYLDDYQFERVWANPVKYGEMLADWQCVLTPDFSLYRDMPSPMQRWNCYRSRFVGAVWQSMGLNVVPTLQWSDIDSCRFAFDGLPVGSTVSVSSVGVLNDRLATYMFQDGYESAMQALQPETVLWYGNAVPDVDMTGCIRYKNDVTERMDARKARSKPSQLLTIHELKSETSATISGRR